MGDVMETVQQAAGVRTHPFFFSVMLTWTLVSVQSFECMWPVVSLGRLKISIGGRKPSQIYDSF